MKFYHRFLVRYKICRSLSFLLKCLPGGVYVRDICFGKLPSWKHAASYPQTLDQITIAVICDDMTWMCLEKTCNVVYLTPQNWFQVMEEKHPDLFFCEATWSGLSSMNSCWTGRIIHDTGIYFDNRFLLKRILNYCKKVNIPTVFWNKEDPVSDNERYHFTDTALLFDHIFTTAKEQISIYETLGHSSVHLMMFGFSPEIFPPLGLPPQNKKAVFLGSWYAKIPQRCKDMMEMIDWVLDMGFDLTIYDRNYGTEDPDRRFPDEYQSYVRPGISYNQISKTLEEYRYLINLNTVKDSETMFARRVFEGMASERVIISNTSKGMKKLFPDSVWYMKEFFDQDKEDEFVRLNQMEVYRHYTIEVQMNQLLNIIKENYFERKER